MPPTARGDHTASARAVVTVGTTSFDDLVHAVCTEDVIRALKRKGYDGLHVQIGRGSAPSSVDKLRALARALSFSLEIYDYIDDFDAFLRASKLVISHAGAGSVFETLRHGERAPFLLVVVNERLMDNHQRELAMELADRGCLRWCVPSKVLAEICALDADGTYQRRTYERGTCRLSEHLNELLF